MKIERINENSISLTMNREELVNRNLKLADLSYGSEKARELLVEMINLANAEIGFKADSPLAVEAVPLKDGDIKLIITKIMDPDELDSRYSKFTPSRGDSVPFAIMKMLESTIDKFEDALKASNIKGVNEVNTFDKLEIRQEDEIVSIFEFEDIDKASDAAKNIKSFDYTSVFYKDEKSKTFYLVLSIKGNVEKNILQDFNRVCNTLAEYGTRIQGRIGMNQAYYEEHYKVIIKDEAIKKLGML